MSGNRKSIPKIAGLIPLSGRRAGQRLLILFAGGLLCCAGLVFAVKSYHRREPVSALPAVSPTRQRGPQLPGALRARLSLQPEADRFRRRLGRRFLDPGREVSVLTGTLTIGAASHTMRIIRTQQEDDELVTIAFDGGPPALTWSAAQGARSASGPASGVLRELAERLALDSPDQFILAQLRGASYFTVARDVKPVEAEGVVDYEGPTWDLVRVAEPDGPADARPQSAWRLYFLNSATGLLDRIISEEEGETLAAELSGWASQDGEEFPTRFTWSRKGQVVMELALNTVAHETRQ